YLSSPEHLGRINRVVFVQLTGRDSCPGIAEDMTVALSHAIGARRLFRMDVVTRDDPRCKTLSLDGWAGFTIKQLRDMRETFQCDAILLGAIRDFRPHPRMQMGLDLRLMDLRDGRLVWGIDHVWDTTDKAITRRVKRFFNSRMRDGYEPMNWQLAMISPKVFEKFVAFEVVETLPEGHEMKTNRKPRQWATLEKNEKIKKNSRNAFKSSGRPTRMLVASDEKPWEL
ncbi:MAG: hypothetical protein KAV00_15330, partial [Phycisphaerae bacterium]|nr:hypothetical protein [Phycisphaerae bacterium]